MAKIIFLITTLLVSLSTFGKYSTRCELREGKAYGYVSNQGEAFEIDGTVWFHFYDNSWNLIDRDDSYEYEYVSSRDTEEIEVVTAPSRATQCTFSIDEAIENPEPDPGLPSNLKFITSCVIMGTEAIGYVHNQGESFTIDGTIWFYFYDNRGTLIDDEDDYEYEYISARDTEEIDRTSAPSNAATCSFDLRSAIR